jgi:toxin ParE1/3/4
VIDLRVRAAAQSDLDEIESYSAEQFGPEVACAYMLGLSRAFGLIAEYPRLVQPRPEYGGEIRCKTWRSHRIFYLVQSNYVEILRVLHVSQDAAAVLRP